MQSSERRLAERLEQKLEDDYLLWWDVPIGPKQTFTEFVVMPRAQFNVSASLNKREERRACASAKF